MIAPVRRAPRPHAIPAWQGQFLQMLPAIQRHVRIAFHQLGPEAQEEAVEECLANALVAYLRLVELDKADLAYPAPLARYAVWHYRVGRRVGHRLNIRDVLSPYARSRRRVFVERLDRFDESENAWREAVVQDTRSAPVPEVVCFRMDFADWLARLPQRPRRIALSLAVGNRTGEVSRRFGVSSGRISQIRRALHDSWRALHHEPDDALLSEVLIEGIASDRPAFLPPLPTGCPAIEHDENPRPALTDQPAPGESDGPAG